MLEEDLDIKKDSPSTDSDKDDTIANDPNLHSIVSGRRSVSLDDIVDKITQFILVNNPYELELLVIEYMVEMHWAPTLAEFAKKVFNFLNDLILVNNDAIDVANYNHQPTYGARKFKLFASLTPVRAAHLVTYFENIKMVCTPSGLGNPKIKGVVAHYVAEGPKRGTFEEIDEGLIHRWALDIAFGGTQAWKNELYRSLQDIASMTENRVVENSDPNLIFMNNCIFNYKTKERIEFSSDYVTLRKHDTNLPEALPAVPLHTKPDGTVISLMDFLKGLAPYVGGVELLIKLAGACLRNKYNWRTMVTLFNTSGKNGKSTFLDMLKALVGESGTISSSLSCLAGSGDAGRFALSSLPGTALITCEDSDSGAYIRDNSRLKSIISHDVVSVERKGEPLFDYRPHALIVCAANDIPKTKDKGQAWLDRNIFVPFTGEFRGQADDKSIREVWVVSKDVCEFMAYEALIETKDYFELPEPPEAIQLKEEFTTENDPVVEFYNEEVSDCVADFLPNKVLWEKYLTWIEDNRPSTPKMTKIAFIKRLNEVIKKSEKWIQPKSDSGDGLRLDCGRWRPNSVGNYRISLNGSVVVLSRERGIVRKKMWEYCKDNNTDPYELSVQGKYEKVCDDLRLSHLRS